MKLIRCYIENFGGLHQYTVDFTDGLTVILAPNGFGKTTLAEFIRAMLYGFPRSGKDLEKNLRGKYLPWQGGRYGGSLVFEHGGKCYRLERTFGETARQDKAMLYDEATRRESRDFSPDSLGVQLFGMDADSFLRTTYLPQTPVSGPLSTDSIRAKLANLLEDSDDLAGYEKAIQRLKDKRTTYAHYRGSGGSISETQQQMTAVQNALDDCRKKEQQLQQTAAEIYRLRQAHRSGEQSLQSIRTRLTDAAAASAEAVLANEHARLTARHKELTAKMHTLVSRYPKGLPAKAELDGISQTIDETLLLQNSLRELPAEPVSVPKKLHGGTIPLLLFGILAAIMGTLLLMLPRCPVSFADLIAQVPFLPANRILIGGVCCGTAAVLWGLGLVLQMKQRLRRELAAAEAQRAEAARIVTEEAKGKLAALQKQAAAFNRKYGLQVHDRASLRVVERDTQESAALHAELLRSRQALEHFAAEHGEITAPSPIKYDLNSLKAAERRLTKQQTECSTRLLQLEQTLRTLQQETDRIPALTDELAQLTARKAEDTHRCRLLDETIDFLQQAREALSARYLDSLQTRFGNYLHRLTGEDPRRIAVNSDLEIQLERAGAVRPLSQFSAGQSDLVQLCMRLALADTLFGQERCFMILDDPFVNLDDTHLQQALALLRELAQERQIIYLVCSRSRIGKEQTCI